MAEKEKVVVKQKAGLKNTVSAITKRIEEVPKYSMFGASAMGFPEKISTVRGVMMVRHTSQRVVLRSPEFPMMYSGAENPYGQRSSWNIKATSDYKLMKKFKKFADVPNSPVCYIFQDLSTGKYKCEVYEPSVNLVEKYGFQMFDYISNYNEGDIIPKGAKISQSSSYVNDNYCGGVNARMAYAVLPELTEDAIIISESLAKRLEYDMVDVITVRLPKNSYLLNKYGNDKIYKPFPDIGEVIQNGIICSIRENSFVSSLNEASIPHINDINYHTKSGGIVTDIDIYTNTDVNTDQFNYYLSQIRDWYSNIYAYISTIRKDKSQDDCSLIDMMNKAQKYLSNSTWVSKEYVEDTIIKFKVLIPMKIKVGQKIVGRYGNKSVIGQKPVPDHLMPKTEDGRPLDMIANALAVPNRIIAFAVYESELTFQIERIMQHAHKMESEGKSKDEIMDLICDFMGLYNEKDAQEVMRVYGIYPEETYADIMKNGINIRIEPFGKPCVRDSILMAQEKYKDIIKPYELYTKLRHRWVKLPETYSVGYQYTWVLKQEPSKAMSAVATGRTTLYDLPVKTRQYNKNLRNYSDNPIKFGEYDTYSFLAGVGAKSFAKLTSYFRGSQYTDNSILMGQLNDMEIDKTKYNTFPQLDNLKNVLKLMGNEMRPDIFGHNTIGAIDEERELLFNNVKIKISLPYLRYCLIIYSYYLQYDEFKHGMVDMDDFLKHMMEDTKVFEGLDDEYISSIFDKFFEILPNLLQLKEYV